MEPHGQAELKGPAERRYEQLKKNEKVLVERRGTNCKLEVGSQWEELNNN